MDKFMIRAVQLAVDNVHEGGQPFGAVLVKDQQAIAEGVNELHKKHDISGHAEMLAIRRAQAQWQTNDLSGTIMYASGEPCPMCLTAMYFAGIEKVYYCASVEEAVEAGLGKSKEIYEDLKKTERSSERSPLLVAGTNALGKGAGKPDGAVAKAVKSPGQGFFVFQMALDEKKDPCAIHLGL